MNKLIYLDYNATTPCDDLVLKEMLPFFKDGFANPSSNHSLGWMAREAIENATITIALTLGVKSSEIVYTSGATEGINMVLKGVFKKYKHKGSHIITVKTEHKAVLDTCENLTKEGARITYLDVDSDGIIDLQQLKNELTPETILVSVMLANNETGAIQPIERIAELTKANGTLLFSDATQALGKIKLNIFFNAVDLACFSAHKLYGPKGIGFTYIKNTNENHLLESFIQGGGQQKGMRGGTLNTTHIIGLSKAIALSYENLEIEHRRIGHLRDTLEQGLLSLECTSSNSYMENRLPGTCNISFDYVDGAALLRSLSSKLAISNGSACNSASVEPSHVLTAMNVKRSLAYASIRMGVGRYTTEDEIDEAIAIISKEVDLLRQENILWERKK